MDQKYAILVGTGLFRDGSLEELRRVLTEALRQHISSSDDQVVIIKTIGQFAVARFLHHLELLPGGLKRVAVRRTADVQGLVLTSIIEGRLTDEAFVLSAEGTVERAALSSRMQRRMANIAALSISADVDADEEADPWTMELPDADVCTWDGYRYVPDMGFYSHSG